MVSGPTRGRTGAPDPLAAAVEAVRTTPDREDAWKHLEDIASSLQKPDDVAALYREVLQKDLPPVLAGSLGKRAIRFHEEWFGETHPGLIDVLLRSLEVEPTSEWAFERLTVVLTVSERWSDLLAAYDRALAASLPPGRRAALLGEAANVAKDFAGQPDRAIGYLKQLRAHQPADAQIAASLERLLERQERFGELIDLWRSRQEELGPEDADSNRERTATCLVDRLADPLAALGEIALLSSDSRAIALLERILGLPGASPEVRHGALTALRRRYEAVGRTEDLVRVLGLAASVAEGDEKLELHREAGERLVAQGRGQEAIEHYDAILAQGPEPQEQLAAARRLGELLEDGPRRLAVLERLASIEPRAADRRASLGQAARLAGEIGEVDRALESWQKRLDADPSDVEALDAIVSLHDREKRWEPLVEVLRRRATARGRSPEQRADLVRIAAIQANELDAVGPAISTWLQVVQAYGDEPASTDALTDLFATAARWDDQSELLDRACGADSARLRDLLVRLGDVKRQHLAAQDDAVDSYRRALDIDPRDKEARAGLFALLEVESCRAKAASALAGAAARTEDSALSLKIAPTRLAVAAPGERAGLLRETSKLEEQSGDAGAALRSAAGALVLAPPDEAALADVLRLAEFTLEWSVAAEAIGEAAAAAEAPRACELRALEGSILEKHLDEPARALGAYSAAGPSAADAVVRVAARAGQWETAARAAVASARAAGRVDPAVLERLERNKSKAAWEKLARATSSAVAEARDLEASAARDLETRVAAWHRDRLADPVAAQVALQRAVGHDGRHVPTLQLLADLQRRTPGRPLHDTLLSLADATAGDLDALREAAAIALERLGDAELARRDLERLREEALGLARRGREATGKHTAEDCSTWSLGELARLAGEAGDHERRIDLLVAASEATRSIELLHQAVQTAVEGLNDPPRAIDLCRRILAQDTGDARAIERLAALYAAGDRTADLLALRRHELGLAKDADRRIALRLEIARLVGAIEERGGRLEALRANLDEAAGHEQSIDALCEVLSQRTRFAELSDILADQAARLEAKSEPKRAARLWLRVARVSEKHLGNVDRALACFANVARLDPCAEALESSARLHLDRGEHAAAAGWLERLWQAAPKPERSAIALRLAAAWVGAALPDSAAACLERAAGDDPASRELRDRLAELYRTSGAWEPLARLLVDGCAHAPDTETIIAWAREAASIHEEKLGTPDRAVAALERAHALVPEDRWVRGMLAQGLRAAGRLDEARALLEGLLEEFGRRRSPDRAAVHHQLARVARAQGRAAEALDQLELASSMDVGNVRVLGAIGELAREQGQLERSERAYRALLLLLRRRTDTDGLEVSSSEVLWQLSRIAAERGQSEPAKELLESALDAAVRSDSETSRLERALSSAGDHEACLRVLRARLDAVPTPEAQAPYLARIASVLEDLGRVDEALDARLQALEIDPGSAANHDATRALAARAGRTERYVGALEALVDHGRRREDAHLGAELLLRMGEAIEHDRGDLEGAAATYARACKVEPSARVLEAVARVAGARGDRAEQTRALETLARGGSPDVLYRLAEAQLSGSDTIDAGLESLSRALDREPQFERAMKMLDAAKGQGADVARVLPLYEWVARGSGDGKILLEFLERRASMPLVTPEQVREGVEAALARGEEGRAEALMVRAAERARALPGGIALAGWALVPLARRRKAAGDVVGAVSWWHDAASSGVESEAVRELGLELASLADPATAAGVYERLLSEDPAVRRVWEPLVRIYRELGDLDRLSAVVTATLAALVEPAERNLLRMERVRLLLAKGGDEQVSDAIEALRDVLLEDPEHREAEGLLADHLEKAGKESDLSDLLWRQLEAARAKRDAAAQAAISIRLGSLLSRSQPGEAKTVYRAALAVAPADRTLLHSMLKLLAPEDDPAERADLCRRVLDLETGPKAATLALEVADTCERAGDKEGALRALEHGHRASPEDEVVKARLERHYRENQEFLGLAEMLVGEAARTEDPARSVALYREAASIQRDLGNPATAADLLSRASALGPGDVRLVMELAQCRRASGELAAAVGEVDRALDAKPTTDDARVALLELRAELRQALEDDAGSVEDLESAFAIAGDAVLPGLLEALGRRRARAIERHDHELAHTVTLRLVRLHVDRSKTAEARALLEGLLAGQPEDLEALHAIAELDLAEERWEALAPTLARLVQVERTPEERCRAAVRLAEVCRRLGRAGDARFPLESLAHVPGASGEVRDQLRRIYEEEGAHRELAELLMVDAEAAPDAAARFARLRQAGVLFLQAGDPAAATPPLQTALGLRPGEHDTSLLLAEAYTADGLFDEAGEILGGLIAAQKRKKSPEMGELLYRMSRLSRAACDRNAQLEWLKQALEADKANGRVAGELADLAETVGDWETALKALQAVTLMKASAPMSHPVAFLRQAKIAMKRGERPRAVLWAKRALVEDPSFGEAKRFLEELGDE
ncbi:MAG: tetratricopeptide repeat protein [Deltaproteobacteria bacterium]|nr:tetratricopeptide repeat protein [Deltaproteobacteria bacterium]